VYDARAARACCVSDQREQPDPGRSPHLAGGPVRGSPGSTSAGVFNSMETPILRSADGPRQSAAAIDDSRWRITARGLSPIDTQICGRPQRRRSGSRSPSGNWLTCDNGVSGGTVATNGRPVAEPGGFAKDDWRGRNPFGRRLAMSAFAAPPPCRTRKPPGPAQTLDKADWLPQHLGCRVRTEPARDATVYAARGQSKGFVH
jgi:hypothetical protein